MVVWNAYSAVRDCAWVTAFSGFCDIFNVFCDISAKEKSAFFAFGIFDV